MQELPNSYGIVRFRSGAALNAETNSGTEGLWRASIWMPANTSQQWAQCVGSVRTLCPSEVERQTYS